jgi:hypothetical protein
MLVYTCQRKNVIFSDFCQEDGSRPRETRQTPGMGSYMSLFHPFFGFESSARLGRVALPLSVFLV